MPPGVVEEVLWTFENNYPTAMEALPNGRLIVGLRDGRLFVAMPGAPFPESPIATVPAADVHEGGVLGFALDPAFAVSRRVYFSYVEQRGWEATIMVKYLVLRAPNLDAVEPGSITTVLELTENAPSQVHYGGGLMFLDDGSIVMGLGDDGRPDTAQNLDSTRGKVLRFLPDGSVPTDNPLIEGRRSLVYAYGLRNPFRIHRDEGSGRVYVCDVGQQAWEEMNELVAGANYGWPILEGPSWANPGIEPPANYREPALALVHQNDGAYTEDLNAAIALTDGLNTGFSPEYPASLHNLHLLADWGYQAGRIFRIEKDAQGTVTQVSVWRQGPGAISDLAMAGGLLYAATTSIVPSDFSQRSGSIFRFRHVGEGGFSATATATPTRGPVPLDVVFEPIITADDPGLPVSLRWEFGDGATSTSHAPTHRYALPGRYSVRLEATDGLGRISKSTTIVEGFARWQLDVLADVTDVTTGRDLPTPPGTRVRVLHPETLDPVPVPGGIGLGANEFPVVNGMVRIEAPVEVTADAVVLSFQGPGLAPRMIHVSRDGTGSLRLDASVRLARSAIRGVLTDTLARPIVQAPITARRDGTGAPYRHPGLGSDGSVLTDSGGHFYVPFPAAAVGDPVRLTALPDGDRRLGSPEVRLFVPMEGYEHWQARAGLFDGGAGCTEFGPSGATPTYEQVEELFTRQCIGCHGPVGAYAGLRLDAGFAWAALVEADSAEAPGVLLVEPGRPDRSYLVEKISCLRPQVGVAMPTGGLMEEADRRLVIDWIAGMDSSSAPPLAATLWRSRSGGESPVLVELEVGITGGRPPYQVEWDFGDGVRRGNANRRVTYPFVSRDGENSTAFVQVQVRDAAGAVAVAQTEVAIGGRPVIAGGPVASFHLPHGNPRVGRPALIDATDSFGGAPVVRWEWDFEDDGTIDAAFRRGTVEHTFTTPGEHRVRLRVWDSLNRVDEQVQTLVVDPTNASNPYEALALLQPGIWEAASVEPFFRAPVFTSEGGLGLTRPVGWFPGEPVFGFWQTAAFLEPLPAGTYRLRFHLEREPLPPGSFHPELRIRAFRADNSRSSMAVAAHLEADKPLPSFVDVMWTSDGQAPWRVAIDMISVLPEQAAGYRVTRIDLLAP